MSGRLRRALTAGALVPVLVTFGVAGWFDLTTSDWLVVPQHKDAAEAAVAGASTEQNEQSADWTLAKQSGRQPEIVAVPAFVYLAPADAVRAAGVPVGERDLVASYPDSTWGYGGLAQVWRAQSITIKDGRKVSTTASWQPTVADVLTEANIELGEQDRVDPALTAPVQTLNSASAFLITITRVEVTNVVVKESIPITTTYKDDATLEKGTEKVESAGQAGVKALTYLVRREDGVETQRTLQSTAVEKTMSPKVVRRGTKVISFGTGKATYYTCSLNHVAASNVIARNTKVKVVNTANGRSTVVTVIGTGGPSMAAIVDLSCDAFEELAGSNWRSQGVAPVRVEKYYP